MGVGGAVRLGNLRHSDSPQTPFGNVYGWSRESRRTSSVPSQQCRDIGVMITSVASTILITSCLITLGVQKEEYGAGTLRVQYIFQTLGVNDDLSFLSRILSLQF